MNIQDELKNDRLAVDVEAPHVFIRSDLYRELLGTSMFSCALRVIKMPRLKKWLLKIMQALNYKRFRRMITEEQLKYYLAMLLAYVNDERMKEFGTPAISVVNTLYFTVVDEDVEPLYIGMYDGVSGDCHISVPKDES